jgi:Flp pilus assembly protein TadG
MKPLLHLAQRIRRGINLSSDHGFIELLETVLAIPVLLILVATIWYFGRVWYTRAAVEDAAGVGARWAATSLMGAQGCRQAREAMQQTLAGYALNASAAHISVRPQAAWGRGQRAVVNVSYIVDQSRVPLLGKVLGNKTVETTLVVPIDRYVNRYGWEPCT